MPLKALPVWLRVVFFCLLAASRAPGYLVGPPVNLDKLAAEADLVFKGEALADATVEDESFRKTPGYAVHETRFKIISNLKGDAGGELAFRHYDEDKEGLIMMYTPQFYHFAVGQTYIVFAHKTAAGAQQVRMSHTGKMDLGVLHCRDKGPVAEKALPAIYWTELTSLRASPAPADVLYAITQLDEMSDVADDHYSHTSDFSRVEVLAALRPLMTRPEPEIAQAAIRAIGWGSPYLRNEQAPFWLGTVGVANPGLSQMNLGMRNAGAALCWRDLAAVANSAAAPETRALAIRALGLVKERELREMLDRTWRKAPEPPVRAAAALLLADFADHGKYIGQQFEPFTVDPAPEVRQCAAYAIGFAQNPAGTSMLVGLLKDKDKNVRKAASQSLFSFRSENPEVAAAFKASLGIKEFEPFFLLALARSDPGAHLEALAKVVEEKTQPENWDGGQIPAFTAWQMLFRYLRDRPVKELTAGQWDRYLDALEKVGQYSSSEPRDIYAFYLRSGLRERAAKYRAAAKKAVTYDMDYFFDQADKNPAGYMGN
ncbi:MAG TPA: HEAT repeat domain-containing protein [Chthoniobacteraceae bacterium]|jgi:HEAT repeat protein|nr:HEAT repeat domain-containing protein [Chthoniobacteraceae bacterium]